MLFKISILDKKKKRRKTYGIYLFVLLSTLRPIASCTRLKYSSYHCENVYVFCACLYVCYVLPFTVFMFSLLVLSVEGHLVEWLSELKV